MQLRLPCSCSSFMLQRRRLSPSELVENGDSCCDSLSLCASSLILVVRLLSCDSCESCECASLTPLAGGSCLAFFWIFLTLARWFWNHTWCREMRYELEQIASPSTLFTCTILRLSPVSLARFSRTLRHGLGDTSKEALKARRCCVLSMVRGRLGPRRPSSLGGNSSSP